ncbi:MAG: DUF3014 domain-containing protein [Acidobacteriota bacterium]|nr:DUF3014 domain-containing protein [Acidobacteriota bacterium]
MEESQKIVRTAIIILIIVIAAVGVYYLFLADRGRSDETPGRPAAETVGAAAPVSGEPPANGAVTIPLDRSDGLLRELAGDVSTHAVFMKWLGSGNLIRRFVAAVDAVANGLSPRPQADFFTLAAPFSVVRRNGKTFLNPASYERYNVVADVLDSVSVAGCAKLYRDFQSQIREAYRDLGYPQGDFHRVLLKAVNELLRTPIVEAPVEVEKTVAVYAYVDARLEGLSVPQKHLLRMGPENVQLIQAKLRELLPALGFAESDLAASVRLVAER